MSHAAGHHGHEFRACQIRQKRPDGYRRFRLSHENTGRDVERLRTAGAHHPRHDPGGNLNDELHDAEVIEHSEKRADENDGRQYLKGKIEAEMGTLLPEIAENKLRADIRVAKQTADGVAGFLKNPPPGVDSQHTYGKGELQT